MTLWREPPTFPGQRAVLVDRQGPLLLQPMAPPQSVARPPQQGGTLATSLDSIFKEFLRVSRVRDLVRESSRNLLEEFEDPSDLLE